MKRLAIAICLPIAAASAAIVSEENDLYTVVPTFSALAGTSASPGIRSPFIPFGTYTDGSGSAEYLRVSTNLLGVLYSAVDGYWERYHIPQGVRPEDSSKRYYPTVDTNETRRLVDILNATNYVYRTGTNDESYAYRTVRGAGTLEHRLAHQGSYRHEGLAAEFGGPYLDELTGNAQPPISTEWSTTYPFLEAASNDWFNVYPTYSALACDDYFWPTNEYGNVDSFARGWEAWMYPSHLAGIWANDYGWSELRDEAEALQAAIDYRPLTNVMEDVLARDPGWTTNAWPHWRNGTRRLDWTRLGIVCQLERHMETTYRAREYEDLALPLNEHWCRNMKTYVAAPTAVTFSLSNTTDSAVAVLQDDPSSWTWTLATNEYTVITNFCGYCFPSARLDRPGARWDVEGSASSYPALLAAATVENEVSGVASAFRGMDCTNGTFEIAYQVTSGIEFGPDGWETRWTFSPLSWTYTDSVSGETTNMTYSGGFYGYFRDGDYVCTNYLSWAKVFTKTALSWATDVYPAAAVYTNLLWESPAWPTPEVMTNEWVASVIVPNVEVMQSVTNDTYWIGSSLEPMPWSDLEDRYYYTNGYEQVYRLAPDSCTDSFHSYTALRDGRRASLALLNYEVQRKFADVTGQNAPDAALALCPLGADEAKLEQLVTGAEYSSSAMLNMHGEYAVVTGDTDGNLLSFKLDDGDGNQWRIYPDASGDYTVGALVFNASAGGGYTCTNVTPCRVDGHQNQLIKTLWKFRNLRDSSL